MNSFQYAYPINTFRNFSTSQSLGSHSYLSTLCTLCTSRAVRSHRGSKLRKPPKVKPPMLEPWNPRSGFRQLILILRRLSVSGKSPYRPRHSQVGGWEEKSTLVLSTVPSALAAWFFSSLSTLNQHDSTETQHASQLAITVAAARRPHSLVDTGT